MSRTSDYYYHILGVSPNSSLDSIKRAYRLKAKEFHPDKNHKPDANEKFILLTEAYEYLTGQSKTKFVRYKDYYEEWENQTRQEARQRAREHAKMKYEEFKKSDYYKNSQAAMTVFEHFYFFSSILILMSPIWGLWMKGWNGFFGGIAVAFLSAPYWAGIFQDKIKIDFRSFWRSSILIIQIKPIQYVILSLVNLIVLFRYTLNSEISTLTFVLILFVFYGLATIAYWRKISFLKDLTKTGLFLCFIPTAFNLFFLINYTFSFNRTTETYSFVYKQKMYGESLTGNRTVENERPEKISYIDLENNKYENYHWFRMFFSFDNLTDKQQITYTFATGVFGIRVLKDYSFN